MEGPQGFDQSSGLWEARGWRQVDALRRKLEKLKELRELVRSLGRAGGRGPRRRAPEEVRYSKYLTETQEAVLVERFPDREAMLIQALMPADAARVRAFDRFMP